MNQEGKRGTKTGGTQRIRKRKLQGGCEVSQERVWQGRAEARGGGAGMVQSSTPSNLLNFLITHSTTPPGTVFFSDWDMQGHQKLQIDHRTVLSSRDRPAQRGCLKCLSRGYRSPIEGAGRESRQNTQITNI